jgi:NAD(P)-dependent dehydrogenase (short-subunit alcohol dehydrogenase family)
VEDLAGRTAVVTGAASGIGRALALACAQAGMNVVLADLEEGALLEAASAVERSGAAALAVRTDVSVAGSLRELAERTREAFGSAHLVCNNAGVFVGGTCWEAPLSDYEWVFGVNVWGVIHGIQAFVPMLLEQGEGHVLNTASMAGVTALPFTAPYVMSKHAGVSLSESLFLELQAKGSAVGVSVLCPELIATRIGESDRNRPEHLKRDGPSHPERDLVEGAIRAGTAQGLDPAVVAARALEAVRAGRLYVFPPKGDPWRAACDARLDDLREARNPSGEVPGSDDF